MKHKTERTIMKILKFYLAVAIGTTLIVGSARGQDATSNPSGQEPFYRANEFSIDAFASGSLGKQYIDDISGDTLRHHGRLGAGLGGNYFITRYLGLGGDVYSENTTGRFIDSASGNLIGRLPIGDTGLAPYVFGG